MIENEKISLDELYDKKREIENLRLSIYNKILQRVHKKIKLTAQQKHEEQYLFYIVPEVMIGVPRYNVNLCVAYLIEKLEENGFVTKYTHPNMLFISWKHYIPSYKREELKRKHNMHIDGFGNTIKQKETPQLLANSNKQNVLQSLHKKDNTKLYTNIKNYKPLGIYNKDIIKKIDVKLD